MARGRALGRRGLRGEGQRSRYLRREGYPGNFVQPDYFLTLRVPLLSGRLFTAAEMEAGQAVVVNRAMAQRLWPGEQAVGQQLRIPPNPKGAWSTVVGVVDDAISTGLTQDRHTPALYLPYQPAKLPGVVGRPPGVVLIVRSLSDPAPVMAAIRGATYALDPEVAIPEMSLTETALVGTLAGPRFNMALLTAFAVLALALAAVGLARVVGYAAASQDDSGAQRTTVTEGESVH
ncbi:MAG TPA: ABC transporter permease [Gammaproteobacteria bacterium]|nr:ABC transporter permease [Gammaproteobacteria bacterium]